MQQSNSKNMKFKKILIIDPDDNFRSKMTDLFIADGSQVIESKIGIDTASRIRDAQVDLIWTEIQLPILNGFEVIEIIRTAGVHVPVVFCSNTPLKNGFINKYKNQVNFNKTKMNFIDLNSVLKNVFNTLFS